MGSVPLEKKMIPSPKPGVERLVPALNKDWVEPREWMAYQVAIVQLFNDNILRIPC